ncbi:ciliogenesis and planar polarity effector 2 isoform X1 [Athene noctua]|uniref:ciliogenesis and planar polarity effector 2 isoform X1 n=1 Tax=Athene noctua TaxID=126797 RepID=UPI003EBEB785
MTSSRGGSGRRFRGGAWRRGGARCWSRAGSCPPLAVPTWTPSCRRTSGACSVCWSTQRCPPAWPPPSSPTNSSSPAKAASARRPWWPRWGGPPCPLSTTRPWPRASGRPVIFQLHFWDCGDSALKKFEHLLPACKEEADAILFLFSFTDRSSFEELPAQMSRVVGPDEENLVKVVVGTKFDLSPQADVTEGDVTAFEGTWGVPVLRAGSRPGAGGGRGGLARVAPLLDALVESLWRRDQITAGIAPGDEGSPPG